MELPVQIRTAAPTDHGPIIAVVDDWWGRPIRHILPRLFLDHFFRTSLVAEWDGRVVPESQAEPDGPTEPDGHPAWHGQAGPDGRPVGVLAGFLVGFCSPSMPDEAYIHALGVAPQFRRNGLAGELYERFFALARAEGRTTVRAVTSPVNTTSIAFHRRMGFTVTHPRPGLDDEYVRFVRRL